MIGDVILGDKAAALPAVGKLPFVHRNGPVESLHHGSQCRHRECELLNLALIPWAHQLFELFVNHGVLVLLLLERRLLGGARGRGVGSLILVLRYLNIFLAIWNLEGQLLLDHLSKVVETSEWWNVLRPVRVSKLFAMVCCDWQLIWIPHLHQRTRLRRCKLFFLVIGSLFGNLI